MIRPFRFSFLVFAAVLGVGFSSIFSPAAAQEFSEAQKDQIGEIVREYLLENPQTVIDAIDAYRAQEEERKAKQAQAAIVDHYDQLAGPDLPSAGNPEGDVVVVEFFDYNCGYCKKALPDILKLIEEDPNVRVVFQEMPILGPSSKLAAQWALAAHEQGKYFDYHAALMTHQGAKTEDSLADLARSLGLDIEQMKEDAQSQAIQDILQDRLALAQKIGVRGTPAFIVDQTLLRGYVGYDGLKAAIDAERKK